MLFEKETAKAAPLFLRQDGKRDGGVYSWFKRLEKTNSTRSAEGKVGFRAK
jgi:hypothetical protein